ncbi:hypothetical protein BN80_261 [Yersinia phage phiR1-RT]|uniref:Uncharacterized protein n=1 Tax=Yersinia phage phiR1-RT TaxID=1206558 RepID=I7K3C7_BPPR1|nr:hypothetical protein BN80_261 [Yersinia phage phiR1-RT]CCI88831.1 hypothetical protein BN80_261 [Yersinia phage phiR1-RT]
MKELPYVTKALKLKEIEIIEAQIEAIKNANVIMLADWGTLTNDTGWIALETDFIRDISSPASPWNKCSNDMKPFLRDMYIHMNDSMIEGLIRHVKQLYSEMQGQ